MAPTETTFRDYTPSKGQTYAKNRLDYHPDLYNTVITHHTETGGQLNACLDVGCGPGNVAANLSKHFALTIGLDPSEGMIETARTESLGSDLSPPIAPSSIDLIVAATAAHWFDMPAFWASAARVLKPGGTVAVWGSANLRADPGTPNAAAIQARMDQFETELEPYLLPGNMLTRGLYKELGLPWSVEPVVGGFEEGTFWRKEYESTEGFLALGAPEVEVGALEKMLGTTSGVTRWREDRPGVVGTEGDIVRVFRRDVERLLREGGIEEGRERLKASVQGFLLVVKKSEVTGAD